MSVIESSPSIANLAKSLSLAQSEFHGAKADSENPFFKSRYADLESVWEAIRIPVTKNGLSVTQLTAYVNDKLCVVTRLMHLSGEWIEGNYPIVTIKSTDPQALGAATTYARRFSLSAILGITQTDDDGETAVSRASQDAKSHSAIGTITQIGLKGPAEQAGWADTKKFYQTAGKVVPLNPQAPDVCRDCGGPKVQSAKGNWYCKPCYKKKKL